MSPETPEAIKNAAVVMAKIVATEEKGEPLNAREEIIVAACGRFFADEYLRISLAIAELEREVERLANENLELQRMLG